MVSGCINAAIFTLFNRNFPGRPLALRLLY
jgi:hypothetical protein